MIENTANNKYLCTQCHGETDNRISFTYYDGSYSVSGRYCLSCALHHIVAVGRLVIAMIDIRDEQLERTER
jgi:uncharacterized protein YfeS